MREEEEPRGPVLPHHQAELNDDRAPGSADASGKPASNRKEPPAGLLSRHWLNWFQRLKVGGGAAVLIFNGRLGFLRRQRGEEALMAAGLVPGLWGWGGVGGVLAVASLR